MRVVVLGGRGFLGEKTVAALRRIPSLEVLVAGRSGPLTVDLSDASTHVAIDGVDVVIDLAASPRASPVELARRCVEKGVVWIETSSDRRVVDALRAQLADAAGPGRVVLGAGIFTGISNLLGAEVAKGGCASLEIGIDTRIYTGAGASVVDQMADSLMVPAVSVVDGIPRERPPVTAGPAINFPSGRRKTLIVALPEPAMLAASTGAANITVAFSPRPTILRALFLMMPSVVMGWRWVRWSMRWMFRLLRGTVLRWRAGTVELVASATRADGTTIRKSVMTRMGMAAAGAAIAAVVAQLAKGTRPVRVLSTIDETFALEATLAHANALASEGAEMRLEG